MSTVIVGEHQSLEGACGVGIIYKFLERDAVGLGHSWQQPLGTYNEGGADWLCAGFIHKNELSDRAFKQLSEKFKLKYKTRVRKNKNSGNLFYFAIFDTKGSGIPSGFDEVDEMM